MKNSRAITFDSPGSFRSIEGLQSNIKSTNTLVDIQNLDIITYLVEPNFVNTADKHIGKVFSLTDTSKKLNNQSSWKLWPIEKILSKSLVDTAVSTLNNHGLENILKTMESDFYSDSFEPKSEEIKYKPSKYSLMFNWPLIEKKTSTTTANLLSYTMVAPIISIIGTTIDYVTNQINTNQTRAYHADNNDEFHSNYEVNYNDLAKNEELNLSINNLNVDYFLNKLIDTNLDNLNDQPIKSQLKELKSSFRKEIIVNEKIKIVSREFHISKIKEIMTRLLDVSNKSIKEYLQSAQNVSNQIPSCLPEPIPNFSGRTKILDNIESTFNEKKIIILNSVSGTGKSAIANRYGWKLNDETDYIITWIESDSDLKIQNGFQKFYFQFSQQEIKKKEYLIQIVNKMILNSPKKFLFIFDNCEETTNIKEYLINMPNNAKVLITTNKEIDLIKNNSGFDDKIHLITIDPFDQEEAKDFIKNSISKKVEQNDLDDFCGLIFEQFKTELRPYILTKFIIIIELEIDEKFGSFDSFIEQYKNNKNKMIDDLMKEDKLFELLERCDENILNILYYSSYMDSDFIPINIFTQILKLETFSAVKTLKSKLLIRTEHKKKGIKIHRSFQEEIKKYLERRQNDQYINNLTETLTNILTLMDTREKLVNNKIGTLDHYHNFKKIMEIYYRDHCLIRSRFNPYFF